MQNVILKTRWYFLENPYGDKGFYNEEFGFVPNVMKEKGENYYSDTIISQIQEYLLNN